MYDSSIVDVAKCLGCFAAAPPAPKTFPFVRLVRAPYVHIGSASHLNCFPAISLVFYRLSCSVHTYPTAFVRVKSLHTFAANHSRTVTRQVASFAGMHGFARAHNETRGTTKSVDISRVNALILRPSSGPLFSGVSSASYKYGHSRPAPKSQILKRSKASCQQMDGFVLLSITGLVANV